MTSIEDRLRRRDDATGMAERAARAALAVTLRASEEGLVDIAYGWVDTPVGKMLAAATENGLLRLGFEEERVDITLEDLARKVSPRILQDERRLEKIRRQLGEYFEGRRKAFDMPIDRQLIHGFHRQVLDVTERIPYGQVSTYSEVAGRAGNPRASRAAGNALGSNPIPIVIPCHRVVRTGHGLGGYGGGLHVKQLLLDLEGARL
jgi:methylated-DNA-[protein]-cysteine S-methyltransferase